MSELVSFFDETGRAQRTATVSEMIGALGAGERVRTDDPYYKKRKEFLAWPVARVLAFGFGASPSRRLEFVARDGYRVTLSTEQLERDGAYLAYADAELRAMEPIGPRATDPRPFYLFWSGDAHMDLASHPRPFAVHQIHRARDEKFRWGPQHGFPPKSREQDGSDLFVERCVRCHALNQVGGRIGPDLNVPRNILEYRSEPDVRAYIRDPRVFRYGAMPPHLDLNEKDLDALISFLRAMTDFKSDPGPRGGE